MIKKIISHPYTSLIGRVVLGAIFIFASLYKIMNPAVFAQSVINYKIVPFPMVNLIAIILPWLELTCGICLLLGFLTRGSIVMVTMLMIIFLSAMVSVVVRGIDIGCGCFPPWIVHRITTLSLIRDSFFLLIALHVLFRDQGVLSLDNAIRKRS